MERRIRSRDGKVDRRTLRKINGANNPNAIFSWQDVEKIKMLSKKFPRYGGISKICKIMKASRWAVWKILTKQSYLKNPPKRENINSLISRWVDQ